MFTENKILIWSADKGTGLVKNAKGKANITTKPNLSFAFDSLYAEPLRTIKQIDINVSPLSESEKTEIITWIDGFAIYGLTESNTFIGVAKSGDYVREATSAPPIAQNEESWYWDGGSWEDGRTEQQKIEYYLPRKIGEIWNYCNSRIQTDTVEVDLDQTIDEYSFGTYTFGMDDGTRANFQTALFGVILNLTPNPRYWTPKGALVPIQVTHDDLKLISGTIGNRYDAWIQAYLTHKATVSMKTTAAEIINYDYSGGWPE